LEEGLLSLASDDHSEEEDLPISELDLYRTMAKISLDKDPLKWWAAQGHLPVMQRLARRYLAIPATSAPIEAVWSSGGNIVTPRRNRLDPDNVEMLLFCHENQEYM
jgi:hypothetical protein